MTIEFLLRRHGRRRRPSPRRSPASPSTRWPMAASTTSSAAASIATRPTPIWLVPHFEQMLYDNAQLARVYLHAWALTGDARFREVAEGDARLHGPRAHDRRRRVRGQPGRGHRTGSRALTFTWTAAEIREVLGDGRRAVPGRLRRHRRRQLGGHARSCRASGRTSTRRRRRVRMPPSRRGSRRSRARLLERRAARPQPARDDKALAAWNGLAIAAFADAGRLARRAAISTAAAMRAAEAITGGLLAADGSLGRSWKDGRAHRPGRPRGLRASRRRPARAVRGDVRRALVHDGARADGPRPRAVRRSGRWLLRHRRRPRAARRAAEGRPGQRRPVRATRWRRSCCSGWRRGPARAAIATPRSGRCGP